MKLPCITKIDRIVRQVWCVEFVISRLFYRLFLLHVRRVRYSEGSLYGDTLWDFSWSKTKGNGLWFVITRCSLYRGFVISRFYCSFNKKFGTFSLHRQKSNFVIFRKIREEPKDKLFSVCQSVLDTMAFQCGKFCHYSTIYSKGTFIPAGI